MSDCVYPCPYGWHGDSLKPCTCAPAVVTKYQKRISGPLLDRIDIHIEVPRVDYEKLSGNKLSETSDTIRQRVQVARNIQQTRFANSNSQGSKTESSNIVSNADLRIAEIRQFCKLQDEGQSLMRSAMTQLNLSARAYAQHDVIASSNSRAPSRIWRETRKSSRHTWRRRCSIVRRS